VQTYQNPSTALPGNRNQRIDDALCGIALQPHYALEHYNLATARQFKISPEQTGNGDQIIRLPTRPVNDTRQAIGTRCIESLDTWLIDMDTSVIDPVTKTGGLIDGVALLPTTDYLLWAIHNLSATPALLGYGLTARPRFSGYTLAASPAVRGSTAVINCTGAGLRFSISARVLLNQGGIAIGALYNQGVVTAQTADTITVRLDDDYGAVSETNTDLTNAVPGLINQFDMFEPRVGNTGQLYGNGEYSFTYMASVETDTSSDLRLIRRRGDVYRHLVAPITCWIQQVTAITSPVTDTLCLARWTPVDATSVALAIDPILNPDPGGTGYMRIGIDAAGVAVSNFVAINKDTMGGYGESTVRIRDTTIYLEAYQRLQNPTFFLSLTGFIPQRW